MIDTLRVVRRLRAVDMPAAQAEAFARLLADVRCEGFDPAIARDDLTRAGFTGEQADILIEGAVRAAPPARPARTP